MVTPRQSQLAPSQHPKQYAATTEHIISNAVGIRADAAGAVVIVQNGETVTFNAVQGEQLPLYGDFTIDATTAIITQIFY